MNGKLIILTVALVGAMVLLFLLAIPHEALGACGPAGCDLPAAEEAVLAATPQTTCPVMGGKIKKDAYVDVKGHRVYVCCAGCRDTIKKDPDKYLKRIKDKGETPEPLAAPTPQVCKACNAPKGSAACAEKCRKPAQTPTQSADSKEPTLNTSALAVLLRAHVPFVLLDARTGRFDDGRRIPGAKSLSAAATAEQAAALIESKETLVVTYCSNLKCPASRLLAKRLEELGYTNVIEYPHGIDGWAKAGQKVASVKE